MTVSLVGRMAMGPLQIALPRLGHPRHLHPHTQLH